MAACDALAIPRESGGEAVAYVGLCVRVRRIARRAWATGASSGVGKKVRLVLSSAWEGCVARGRVVMRCDAVVCGEPWSGHARVGGGGKRGLMWRSDGNALAVVRE